MANERNVVDFKIHNLTEEQFQELKEAGQIDPNAVYCTPDTTKERLDALETKTTSLEENKQDKGDYATNTALSQGLAQKQDVATAVNYDNITNCITEIPQDIKLELAGGVLTLKAGSIYYTPNGDDTYTKTTTTADKTLTNTNNNQWMVFVNQGGNLQVWGINSLYSGTTAPSGVSYPMWWDTTNNIIKISNDSGATWVRQFSLPLCIITVSNGAISSIDQVFNGFGYFASRLFALPGVKGLIPNGRNEDGTLKNTAINCTNVKTTTLTSAYSATLVAYNNGTLGAWSTIQYDPEKNTNYNNSTPKVNVAMIGKCVLGEGGQIKSFEPKTAFHAVDYNDLQPTTNSVLLSNILSAIYPIGSVYITTASTNPMATLIKGSSWTLVSSGRALWTGTGSNGNTTIAAGLPNITANFIQGNYGYQSQATIDQYISGAVDYTYKQGNAALYSGGEGSGGQAAAMPATFNASRSSSIYGNSTTVQPPAYVVNVWRRTA